MSAKSGISRSNQGNWLCLKISWKSHGMRLVLETIREMFLFVSSISRFPNLLEKLTCWLSLSLIYKTVHNLNPTFMTQVFEEKDVPYNLRESNSLTLPKAKTTLYGIDTVRYIGKKLRQVLPTEIKESKSLEVFKQKII